MSLWDKAKDLSKDAADKAKQSREDHKQKVAETNDARGKKLAAVSYGLVYMGGYGENKKGAGKLTFYEKRTEFDAAFGKSKSFNIDNNQIISIAIEGRHDVNRRVTVTRLVGLGIFAFAAKKKNDEKEAFITIVMNDGQEAIFHLEKRSPMELKGKLAPAIGKVQQGKALQTKQSSNDYTEELHKLADLKEKGILTEEEFAKKKKQLLGL